MIVMGTVSPCNFIVMCVSYCLLGSLVHIHVACALIGLIV